MRRVIVTGAHGFLGRHVLRDLAQHGVQVATLGRGAPSGPSHIAMGAAPWSVDRIAAAIRSVGPDAVFHLAGGATGPAEELDRLNLGLAEAIMAAIAAAGSTAVFLCCGSAAEYGAAFADGVPVTEEAACRPTNPYGASKLAQTRAALAFAAAHGAPVLVARIFNPLGPGMPGHLALADFARQIAAIRGPRGVLHTGNLEVFRDFADIAHVAAALRILAGNPAARGVVNVCSGEATELRSLVGMLAEAAGKQVECVVDPSRLRPGELRTVIGSTARLAALGAALPRAEYRDVVARLWRDAAARSSQGAGW